MRRNGPAGLTLLLQLQAEPRKVRQHRPLLGVVERGDVQGGRALGQRPEPGLRRPRPGVELPERLGGVGADVGQHVVDHAAPRVLELGDVVLPLADLHPAPLEQLRGGGPAGRGQSPRRRCRARGGRGPGGGRGGVRSGVLSGPGSPAGAAIALPRRSGGMGGCVRPGGRALHLPQLVGRDLAQALARQHLQPLQLMDRRAPRPRLPQPRPARVPAAPHRARAVGPSRASAGPSTVGVGGRVHDVQGPTGAVERRPAEGMGRGGSRRLGSGPTLPRDAAPRRFRAAIGRTLRRESGDQPPTRARASSRACTEGGRVAGWGNSRGAGAAETPGPRIPRDLRSPILPLAPGSGGRGATTTWEGRDVERSWASAGSPSRGGAAPAMCAGFSARKRRGATSCGSSGRNRASGTSPALVRRFPRRRSALERAGDPNPAVSANLLVSANQSNWPLRGRSPRRNGDGGVSGRPVGRLRSSGTPVSLAPPGSLCPARWDPPQASDSLSRKASGIDPLSAHRAYCGGIRRGPRRERGGGEGAVKERGWGPEAFRESKAPRSSRKRR